MLSLIFTHGDACILSHPRNKRLTSTFDTRGKVVQPISFFISHPFLPFFFLLFFLFFLHSHPPSNTPPNQQLQLATTPQPTPFQRNTQQCQPQHPHTYTSAPMPQSCPERQLSTSLSPTRSAPSTSASLPSKPCKFPSLVLSRKPLHFLFLFLVHSYVTCQDIIPFPLYLLLTTDPCPTGIHPYPVT